MKTIGFVPARCGSKSIPLKNIKKICGKPLIYWNLKSLQEAKNVNEIYVATDCEEIRRVVVEFQFPKIKIYKRDKENARDESSTESVMLEFINKHSFNDEDLFILVQATTPFTRPEDFEKAIELYYNEGFDSILSCSRIKKFFWTEDGKPINYDYKNRPRRQDFAGILVENGAFWINTIKNIKTYKNRLSGKIGIYEMPEYAAIDIDEEDDWIIAENLLRKYILNEDREV
ncbi:MAG: acylneuraminate cytidylyltransferase family protein [Candidatus Helarchaeota archaeon]|nr:acylneuraminate cytidylyltransferase family protein [Candidatus Helarchaeota archaeon]